MSLDGSQLVHLVHAAIGTPDVSVVNFTALHELLLMIVKRLELPKKPADLLDKAFPDVGSLSSRTDNSNSTTLPHSLTLYHALFDRVVRLERTQNALTAMPSPQEMFSKAKVDQPITDLYNYMMLSKRLEANEEAVGKAMSLLQEVVNDLKTTNLTLESMQNLIKADTYPGAQSISSQDSIQSDIRQQLLSMEQRLEDFHAGLEDLQKIRDTMGLSPNQHPLSPSPASMTVSKAPTPPVTYNRAELPRTAVAQGTSVPQFSTKSEPDVTVNANRSSPIAAVAQSTSSPRPESKQSRATVSSKLNDISAQVEMLTKKVDNVPWASSLVTWYSLENHLNSLPDKPLRLRPTAVNEQGPSEDLLHVLEQLGQSCAHIQSLDKRLMDMEVDISTHLIHRHRSPDRPATRSDGESASPFYDGSTDDQHELLAAMSTKLAELDQMKEKMIEFEVLLADVPQVGDAVSPRLGEKRRFSSFFEAQLNEEELTEITESQDEIVNNVDKLPTPSPLEKHASQSNPTPPVSPSMSDHQQLVKKHGSGIVNAGSRASSPRRLTRRKEARTPVTSSQKVKSKSSVIAREEPIPKDYSNVKSAKSPQQQTSGGKSTQHLAGGPHTRQTTSNIHVEDVKSTVSNQQQSQKSKSRVFKLHLDGSLGLDDVIAESAADPVISESSATNRQSAHLNAQQQRSERARKTPSKRRRSSARRHTSPSHVDVKSAPSNSSVVSSTSSSNLRQSEQPPTNTTSKINSPQSLPTLHLSTSSQASSSKAVSKQDCDVHSDSPPSHAQSTLSMVSQKMEVVSSRADNFPQPRSSGFLGQHDYKAVFGSSDDKQKKPMTNMGEFSSGQLPQRNSIEARYSKTIRQVIHDDYMGEIRKMVRRIERLENMAFSADDQSAVASIEQIGNPYDDEKLATITRRISNLNQEMSKRIDELDEEMAAILESTFGGEEKLGRTQIAIGDLQSQLASMRKVSVELQAENEEKTKMIEDLTTEAHRLNAEKLDSSRFYKGLDTKVERMEMVGKIDRSEFDIVTNDIQLIITDLLNKLVELEEAWKSAHKKLEGDVTLKLDSDEIARIKTYMDRKHKELCVKIRRQQYLSAVDQAAGIRRKLPFHCLSCDKPVLIPYDNDAVTEIDEPNLGQCPVRENHYTPTEVEKLKQQVEKEWAGDRMTMKKVGKNNMRAFMVHFGKQASPKVFITRPKARPIASDIEDMYGTPRRCGGKHTVTTNSRVGMMVPSGKAAALKDILVGRDLVAAGTISQHVSTLIGADGRPYKARDDILQLDSKLTESLQVARDPIMPLVEELKQTRVKTRNVM